MNDINVTREFVDAVGDAFNDNNIDAVMKFLVLSEALSYKLAVPLVATRANMDDPEVSKYFYVVSCER